MASAVFFNNTSGAGILAEIYMLENAYVAAGVSVVSTDNTAIYGEIGFNHVNVLGTVVGVGSAIMLGNEDDITQGNQIYIGKDATVIGSLGADPDGDFLFTGGTGITIRGNGSRVQNDGLVFGTHFGIEIDNYTESSLSVLINNGRIESFGTAVASEKPNITLHFRNNGTVEGDDASFAGSYGEDRVVNRGEMIGGVGLSGGNDYFDGRKGTVDDGTIYGGEGDDVIRGGAGDEWMSGGDGNDKLTGGKGEDTFIFDYTPNGTTNVDVIKDFSVADDHIGIGGYVDVHGATDLDGRFIANKTGKAEDANDYFIYQTTTGKLFYDGDGKGSDAAVLMAQLDKNLKLTADHFEII